MKKVFKRKLPDLCNCKISIIGLGYVGLPLAIEFARTENCKRTSKILNRSVFGLDINEKRISDLKNGIDNTNELTDNEKSFLNKITFTSNHNDIYDSDVFIVTVPTPIDTKKNPDLNPLISATETISICLKKAKERDLYHDKKIIIYESTVFPGATEEICLPIFEKESNFKINRDFSLGYSPERINPGDRDHRLVNIKKVTSGSDKETRVWVDNFYGSIIDAGTYSVSSIKTAEAAKIIENTQRDLNIALVNELAQIFERIGVDTKEVLDAASTKWNFMNFYPGLVGGHCIGVDPYYLTFKSIKVGYKPNIILAGRKINDSMGAYTAGLLIKKMLKKSILIKKSKILIMGFSFKENCPDIRNSGVINVVNELEEFGCKVEIYDPWVPPEDALKLYKINIFNHIPKNKYSGVFIAVPHKCFLDFGIEGITKYCEENHVIFDLKYLFPIDERIERI